ncbi:hypothetical protein GCM10011374_25760 [Kocuria dechangensis]|uniref:Uncharacterized protein n=1 Tax=Kocuria dechangensis TaxID=1176249 RepID=A0A917GYL7_9MICC|nr:hypothetical protein [Kocuria dechangensis]GGG61547.1 hypothetical protein GCM10011374_25760 [Kocuria dechangensis]
MFKEGAWRDLEPMQKGLVLGVLAGAVLAVLTRQLSWLAVGVFLGAGAGYLVGRRRHTQLQTGHHAQNAAVMSSTEHRPEETPEHREERLRWAATYRGTRMLEGKTDRAGALGQIRDTVPGFGPERYESELEAALARIEQYRVGVRARRAKNLAQAREMDVLNAVFALHYFNRRFSGHVGEYGLGRIDPEEALGDLYTRKQIAEAVTRSNALIEEGLRMGIGPMDIHADMDRLRAAHPGFNDRALSDAVNWGYLIHR